jgi:peptide chain release factor 2
LEAEMTSADFWKNTEEAKKVSSEHGALSQKVKTFEDLEDEVEALLDFDKEAATLADEELNAEIAKKIIELQARIGKLEFFLLFSGKYDKSNAIISIHAGAGGTEAQDWADMLLRMIMRYCEKKGFKVQILDEHKGAEAGYKSITLSVEGEYAYGYLKSESGVHRLVRISPFDAEKMRHTSFAMIEILPELPETEEVVIDPKDLRVDTFLSGGHGGQSVQTTYSAVRIVHIPTGITVSCQNERSQLKNKEIAMKVLRAKLFKKYEEERTKEVEDIRGEHVSAEWGRQIRSYVLHPYKMVKDHRTDFETQDTDAVLDGNLDEFVEQYLRGLKK